MGLTVKDYYYKGNSFVAKKVRQKNEGCTGCTYLGKSGKVCFFKGKISYRKGRCTAKETNGQSSQN